MFRFLNQLKLEPAKDLPTKFVSFFQRRGLKGVALSLETIMKFTSLEDAVGSEKSGENIRTVPDDFKNLAKAMEGRVSLYIVTTSDKRTATRLADWAMKHEEGYEAKEGEARESEEQGRMNEKLVQHVLEANGIKAKRIVAFDRNIVAS